MDEQKITSIVNRLKDQIHTKYGHALNTVTDDQLINIIEDMISREFDNTDIYLTLDDRAMFADRVYDSIRGLGILESIMKNDDITEIMINGPDDIFLERNGRLERSAQRFESEEQLQDIAQKIVRKVGREVNFKTPIVDTRLEDGSRVNIVLPPISLGGTTITIRKFSKRPMTLEQLIRYGSINQNVAKFLTILVKAQYNIFISGGTGSGKTTFLNALATCIPSKERVITIEDSAELQIRGIDNLVRLETRNANTTGSGDITIRDLIRSSLRMRPERIIVGEVRGGEALDMLQAMNTGHDGSLSTGHANSTRDMLSRLETMVLQGSDNLPLAAIRQQIASAIDIIIHLERQRDKSRKTVEIVEVLGYEDGEILLNPLYVFEEDLSATSHETVIGSLNRTDHDMINTHKLERAGLMKEAEMYVKAKR